MDNSIFEKIISNLKNMGYDVQENVNYNDYNFDFLGHTAPLQATKFGKNDYFVAGCQMENPTIDDIRQFSSQLFDYSKHNRANKLLPGILK